MRLYQAGLAAALLFTSGMASANGDGPATPPPSMYHAAPGMIQLDLPTRGMTMRSVGERFGMPDMMLGAVGDPPITRWVYKDYTVYFEHKYVIQSVPKRR